ncbi:MAG TPA: permease-like cell division protein FtsX [Nevskiaceae bacterium]|nr:permease-like cell division protein FtsX [Nevskiaceae bacterium]
MAAEDGLRRPGWLARQGREHARVFFFSLGKLWQRPAATLLSALAIGVTLALPAALQTGVRNLEALASRWEGQVQASLFLRDSVTEAQGQALAERLRQRPGVRGVDYLSREQSLADFRALSGFGEALDQLQDNPLPAVLLLRPDPVQDRAQIARLVEELAALPEVELARLDQQWLERLQAVLALIERLILGLGLVLGLAVVVIIGNTVRLDIEARREEIEVMKLVGAPDAFIRRPFLYTGLWYGLGGALLAQLLVVAGWLALQGPAQALSGLYGSPQGLLGPSAGLLVGLQLLGPLLGLAGAWLSVSRRLGQIEPV